MAGFSDKKKELVQKFAADPNYNPHDVAVTLLAKDPNANLDIPQAVVALQAANANKIKLTDRALSAAGTLANNAVTGAMPAAWDAIKSVGKAGMITADDMAALIDPNPANKQAADMGTNAFIAALNSNLVKWKNMPGALSRLPSYVSQDPVSNYNNFMDAVKAQDEQRKALAGQGGPLKGELGDGSFDQELAKSLLPVADPAILAPTVVNPSAIGSALNPSAVSNLFSIPSLSSIPSFSSIPRKALYAGVRASANNIPTTLANYSNQQLDNTGVQPESNGIGPDIMKWLSSLTPHNVNTTPPQLQNVNTSLSQ
jgi:hypothetical protein